MGSSLQSKRFDTRKFSQLSLKESLVSKVMGHEAQISRGKKLSSRNKKCTKSKPPKYKIKLLKNLTHALLAELDELDDSGNVKDVGVADPRAIDLRNELRCYEIALIEWSLRRTAGNQAKAAVLLGLKPTTLNSKIKNYGISSRDKYPDSSSLAASLRKFSRS